MPALIVHFHVIWFWRLKFNESISREQAGKKSNHYVPNYEIQGYTARYSWPAAWQDLPEIASDTLFSASHFHYFRFFFKCLYWFIGDASVVSVVVSVVCLFVVQRVTLSFLELSSVVIDQVAFDVAGVCNPIGLVTVFKFHTSFGLTEAFELDSRIKAVWIQIDIYSACK